MTLPLLFPNQKTWMTVQFNIDTLYIVWKKIFNPVESEHRNSSFYMYIKIDNYE